MTILPIMLCRGGSKGIPHKNIKILNGKPLLSYVLTEALKVFPKVYLSTEGSEIKYVAREYGAEIIDRPEYLAQDDSPSIDSVKHALSYLKREHKFDYVMLLNACTPFLKAEDLKEVVDIASREKCESVVSLCEDFSSHPSKVCTLIGNKICPIPGSSFKTGERQGTPKIYRRNAAIYMTSLKTIHKGKFFGKENYGYVMPKERSFDINDQLDFDMCEFLMQRNGT